MNETQQRKRTADQDMQTGSGLTRYRSAPSSYFTNLLSSPAGDGFGADDFAELFNPRASSPETQRIFSRFMNSTPVADADNCYAPPQQPQFLPPLPKHEPDHVPQPSSAGEYSSSSTAPYHHPGQNSDDNLQEEVWSSYAPAQIKREGGAGNPGLVRHSSSPAGLFADINIEAGTGAVTFNSPPTAKNYTCSPVENDHRGSDGNFVTDYINPWDENFHEGPSNKDIKRFANSEGTSHQGNEGWNRPATMLSHHLSLPAKMSAELSMEKLLQDSVPCKLRAKRGCATHPRSIAERVRRTKISNRIRKLQELVPNMDKQTNTSDMLDLAADYIKGLQNQLKRLSDSREHCSCPAKHMP